MGRIVGVIRKSLPGRSDMEEITTIVLVEGAVNDYAAYEGFGTAEFVRDYGRKLSFKEAKGYFSWITSAKYRR